MAGKRDPWGTKPVHITDKVASYLHGGRNIHNEHTLAAWVNPQDTHEVILRTSNGQAFIITVKEVID